MTNVGGVRFGSVKEAKFVVVVWSCGVGSGRFVVCLLEGALEGWVLEG